RLHQQTDSHCTGATTKSVAENAEFRLGGPRKIVDILTMERDCLRAVRVVGAGSLLAAGTHHFVLGKREPHVESSKVSKEFSGGMELVTIPCALPPDTHLGEPLRAHDEITLVAGAFKDHAQLIAKCNLEPDGFAGRHRKRQLYLEHSPVLRIAIVRRDKANLRSQVADARNFERFHLCQRAVLVLPFELRPVAPDLAHERGCRLKGIQIQMKRESILR